jgi:hypothetical protein
MESTNTNTAPSEHLHTGRAAIELLQAENASLRAELQALKESQEQQPPHPDSAGTFDLFGLPREIRDAIYEMCLVPGRVFIKRFGVARVPNSDMRYRRQPSGPKAETQLFLVNRKLRLEALAVFLSKNQFIVAGPHDMNNIYWDPVLAGKKRMKQFYQRDSLVKHHLRSISFSLNSIENAPGAIMEQYRGIDAAKYYAYSDWEHGGSNAHSVTRNHNIHNYNTIHLQNRFVANLYLMFAFPGQLRKIEINLEAMACASGCHRLVNRVFGVVEDYLPMRLNRAPHIALLESVDIIGLVNEEEAQSVRRAFQAANSMSEKLTCHVHELPEGYQPWDDDDQGN